MIHGPWPMAQKMGLWIRIAFFVGQSFLPKSFFLCQIEINLTDGKGNTIFKTSVVATRHSKL